MEMHSEVQPELSGLNLMFRPGSDKNRISEKLHLNGYGRDILVFMVLLTVVNADKQ